MKLMRMHTTPKEEEEEQTQQGIDPTTMPRTAPDNPSGVNRRPMVDDAPPEPSQADDVTQQPQQEVWRLTEGDSKGRRRAP